MRNAFTQDPLEQRLLQQSLFEEHLAPTWLQLWLAAGVPVNTGRRATGRAGVGTVVVRVGVGFGCGATFRVDAVFMRNWPGVLFIPAQCPVDV